MATKILTVDESTLAGFGQGIAGIDAAALAAVFALDPTELTIASGAVVATGGSHTVDTEADAASDNLDTITAATKGLRVLRPANTARTVVVRDNSVGSGNIYTPGQRSISLAEANDYILAFSDGTDVIVIGGRTQALGGFGLGQALASTATGDGASLVSIEDAAAYFTGTDVEAALAELVAQLGGATSGTYNFTNGTGTRLADNDAVYPALDKLDQGFVDLKSTANAKGAALVGIEDALTLLTAANVEAALAELAKYECIELADPGTGQAIPVTRSATVHITTAAAETNSLAIPTFVGQRLALICDVYAVGDRVVTSAQAINQAGNTIMTFGAAGDMIVLQAMKVGGALRWRVVSNDGVALS